MAAVLTSFALTPPGSVELGVFRPIYYLGCKASFAEAIKTAIDDVDPTGGRVCDLFSGSGVVGALLASSRDVTAIDIQEYARVLASALLRPPNIPRDELDRLVTYVGNRESLARRLEIFCPLIDYEHRCIMDALDGHVGPMAELLEDAPLAAAYSVQPHTQLQKVKTKVVAALDKAGLSASADTTVARYFGGLYFSFRQAVVLDEIIDVAAEQELATRDCFTAAALSTASSLVNTVGKQFAQPLRPRAKSGAIKSNLANTVSRDRQLDVLANYRTWLRRYCAPPRTLGEHEANRQDYREAIVAHGSEWSVVYADPPYTRDHYSRFYHVLETMCLRDNPAVSHVSKRGKRVFSRGFYRRERHQSPFCIRSTAPEAFETLFQSVRAHDLPLVLSYSPYEAGDGTHPRVVSMSQIQDIARRYYSRVAQVYVNGATHNQLNRSDLKLRSREHAEILLKCLP